MDQKTRVIEIMDELKEKYNLTYTDVGKAINIHPSTLNSVKSGRRNLGVKNLTNLISFYDKRTAKTDIPGTLSRWDEMERRLDAQLGIK